MSPAFNGYAQHAANYNPSGRTRILFVAEAPPNCIDRYFYFEDVQRADWLWIALMKALFPHEWSRADKERPRKKVWLEDFRASGFRLIDAVKKPISGKSRSRINTIRANTDLLIDEVKKIDPECIVLIKATVHKALFQEFKNAGLPVANEEALPFPSSGHQTKFHEKISQLGCVKKHVRAHAERSN